MTIVMMTKALKVSVLVGSILVLINQFDAIFGDEAIRWFPAVLTYCVPFVVFMAGQLSNRDGR
jgi:methyl-accepting chemotaxis protein